MHETQVCDDRIRYSLKLPPFWSAHVFSLLSVTILTHYTLACHTPHML